MGWAIPILCKSFLSIDGGSVEIEWESWIRVWICWLQTNWRRLVGSQKFWQNIHQTAELERVSRSYYFLFYLWKKNIFLFLLLTFFSSTTNRWLHELKSLHVFTSTSLTQFKKIPNDIFLYKKYSTNIF